MHPNATTRTRGIPVGNELRVHPHSPPASFPTGEPAVTRRPFALVSCLKEYLALARDRTDLAEAQE